jgi:1,5-anhydro-D-fructose reductase (1,5-anhydro-D-mannitol-forming)
LKPSQAVVRWGVIGLGRLARDLIAPIIVQSPRSELVACVGSTPEQGHGFAQQFGARRAYSSIDKLASDPEVDAIFIATPNALHHSMLLAAARGGKHVLCEKPFALSLEHGREMVQACRSAGVILRVGFQIRLEEILVRAREVMRSGSLGELRTLQLERTAGLGFTKKPWRLEAAQGGVVFDIMVHLLDLVEWMSGLRFREVSAYSHPDRRAGAPDDTLAVLGNLDGDCHAFLRASREIPYGENSLLVQGSKGMLTTSALRFADEYTLRITTAAGVAEERFPATAIYQREIEAFEEEARGGEGRLASGEDGVRSIEVTNAILESINSRRSVAL